MSQGRPNLTPWGRTEMTSRGRPNLTFKGRPWEADSERPLEDRQSTRTWMCQNLFNFSFRTYSIDQIYLKAFQHSRCIENPVKHLRWSIFCKISWWVFQKYIIYYFKYREFSGIFTINDHISDNSIQINIRFTFTVYEYIISYKYILLSNFIYVWVWVHFGVKFHFGVR